MNIINNRKNGADLIRIKRLSQILPFAVMSIVLASCVNVAAPDKPIVINLNIKIEQEVTVKDAQAVEEAIEENAGIF